MAVQSPTYQQRKAAADRARYGTLAAAPLTTKQIHDQQRPNSTQRGYGYRWQKARLVHLAEHPLCATHLERGETVAATVVDHIVPHKGDPELFWDPENHQSLCKPCHDAKTATEDGGFGRAGGRGGESLQVAGPRPYLSSRFFERNNQGGVLKDG